MFRSTLVKIAIASLSLSAFAQKTESPVREVAADPSVTSRQGQQVNLDDVRVQGNLSNPGSVYVSPDGSVSPMVAIDLSRDFLVAVQGNLDREHLERQNGESR